MRYERTARKEINPREFMPATVAEYLGNSELFSLLNAPGSHHLAANAVSELGIALDNEYAGAFLRQRSRQRGAGQTAAYGD
jgi:hypothetical protein